MRGTFRAHFETKTMPGQPYGCLTHCVGETMKLLQNPLSLLVALALVAVMTAPSTLAVSTPLIGIDTSGDQSAQATCAAGYAHALASADTTGGSYSAQASASVEPQELYKTGTAGGGQAEQTAVGVGFGKASATAKSGTKTTTAGCDLTILSGALDKFIDRPPVVIHCAYTPLVNYDVRGAAFLSESTGSVWLVGTQTLNGAAFDFATPLAGTFASGQTIVNMGAPVDLAPLDIFLNGSSDDKSCHLNLA